MDRTISRGRLSKRGIEMASLSAVCDQLTLAREYAMLGDYDTSLVYFDGVLSLLSKCARAYIPRSGELGWCDDWKAGIRKRVLQFT